MTERVCIYIDGSNFYHLCRENLGGRTDVRIGGFAAWLVGRPQHAALAGWFYLVTGPSQWALFGIARSRRNRRRARVTPAA